MSTLGIGFLVLGGALLLLAIHPFVTYPLTLIIIRWMGARRDKGSEAESSGISAVSILVCAHNEERCIVDKLLNLNACVEALRLKGYHAEALVYFDGCSDRSVELALKVRGAAQLVIGSTRCGKSAGMNKLVTLAQGEILIFTDANVSIDTASIVQGLTALTIERVGCVCGHLTYVNGDEGFTAKTGDYYWRYEEFLKTLESDIDSTISADGALFAIHRSSYRPVPEDIIDDFYTSLSVFLAGRRVIQSRVFSAYERSAASTKDELRRKVRIACRAYNCHRLLKPRLAKLAPLRRYFYWSHKWLRWHAIWLLAFGVGAVLTGLLCVRPGLAAVAFAGLMVCVFAGILRIPPFRQTINLLMTLGATGLGVVKSYRGERFQTWKPPASAR